MSIGRYHTIHRSLSAKSYEQQITDNPNLSLILNSGNQRPDMRQQLDGKHIASLEKLLWLLRRPDAWRRAGEDDSAGREGGSLGEEADHFGDAEDKVTIQPVS